MPGDRISKCVAAQIGYFRRISGEKWRGDARRPERAHVAQLVASRFNTALSNYLNDNGGRREIIRMARGQFLFFALPIFITGRYRFPRARLRESLRVFPSRRLPRSNYGTTDKRIIAVFFSLDGNRRREVTRVHPVAPKAAQCTPIYSISFRDFFQPIAKRSCDKERATLERTASVEKLRLRDTRHKVHFDFSTAKRSPMSVL